MESKDGDAVPAPLTFDNLEDIPAIDSEDSIQSTFNVTHTSVASSVSGPDEVPSETPFLKEKKNIAVDEDVLKTKANNDNRLAANLMVFEDGLDTDNKVHEESSCADDAPSISLAGSTADGGGEQSEGCFTHSFSFTFRPPEPPSDGSLPKEPESKLEGDLSESLHLEGSLLKPKAKVKKSKKAVSKDTRDSDSSVSSRKKGKSNKARIKSKFAPGSFEYIEDRLRGQIFSGWVEERKWVENLAGYRDVIEVDEWEVEMNQTLMCVIRSIPGVLEGKKWINITPPSEKEPSYCLWTLLSTPPNPGHYWFSVSGVAVHPQFGLRVMLKIIRDIHPHDGELAKARRKRRKELALKGPGKEMEALSEQVQEWLLELRQISFTSIWSSVRSTITFSNIKEVFRFVIVLSMTIVVGFASFVRESHHYGIQFLHATGIFFRNITPFLQSLLAFFEKIIGGMYLLLAMVYNDVRRPSSMRQPSNLSGPPPPMAIAGGRQGFAPMPSEPRTIKYVPPEQWVYKSQNSPNDT